LGETVVKRLVANWTGPNDWIQPIREKTACRASAEKTLFFPMKTSVFAINRTPWWSEVKSLLRNRTQLKTLPTVQSGVNENGHGPA